MHKNYQNYFWKGRPKSLNLLNEVRSYSYKIVTESYGKWYFIEKYNFGAFEKIIFDSLLLLDFRYLNSIHQNAWQRKQFNKESTQIQCLLRNQEDRATFFKTHCFDNQNCTFCKIHPTHGLLSAFQKLYYQNKQDVFNRFVLFNLENHPVMIKTYQTTQKRESSLLFYQKSGICKHLCL
ncbi:hypothetical protein [Candidatus Protochlamydia amoebophila]|uniref:hypothetical protein n=1 Tax=Candidatus Protochlamydia amoebophila TaxID=362787 RepID=UPI001BC9FCEC|nr:hypothetical protein [Candidatus Protochlamydia amoebophila]